MEATVYLVLYTKLNVCVLHWSQNRSNLMAQSYERSEAALIQG